MHCVFVLYKVGAFVLLVRILKFVIKSDIVGIHEHTILPLKI